MLEKLRSFFSNTKVTFVQWLVALSCILFIRFFLESFSSPPISRIIASDTPTLLHYYLFFVGAALVLMLVLRYFIPSWKNEIPSMTLFAFLITLMPPIIDFIVSGGKGTAMAYLFDSPKDIVHSFLTFFGTLSASGITLGMRVEFVCIIIGTGILVYVIRKSAVRAIVAMLCIYMIIFGMVALPSLLSSVGTAGVGSSPTNFIESTILHSSTVANNIHGTLQYGSTERMLEIGFDFLMGKIEYIIVIILSLAWFLTYFKEATTSILKNYRPERLAHFLGMVLLGMFVAYRLYPFTMNWDDWLSLVVLLLAFYFSWMSAVCVNDIYDIDIDTISNTSRPIPCDSISVRHMQYAGLIFFILALIGGYLAGYYAFFYIIVFNVLYYVYSAPPLRIKRIPFVATGVIGLCSVSAVAAGFFTFSPVKDIAALPYVLIVTIVVIFSLLPNVRDIKDIEGDLFNGIWTVPTMFGTVWGPRVVGILAGCAYLVVPLVTQNIIIFWGAIIGALTTYWLCIKKPYNERPIFIVYGLFALFVLFTLS